MNGTGDCDAKRRSKVVGCHELLGEPRWHDHDDSTKQRGCHATYLDPKHPTQLAILRGINDLADEKATGLAVDGLGLLYAISL